MTVYPASASEQLGLPILLERLASLTRSELGLERVARLAPARDLAWLSAELEAFDEYLRARRSGESLPEFGWIDVREALRRAGPQAACLEPESLGEIATVLEGCRALRAFFQDRTASYPIIATRTAPLPDAPAIIAEIRRVVEDDGTIKDDASPELTRIRHAIRRLEQKLSASVQSALRAAIKQGYATEDQPTIRGGRLVIPVRAEARRHVAGIMHDSSASGQTVYIEPEVAVVINNDLRDLEGEERREIRRLLMACTDEVRKELPALKLAQRILAGIDLLSAKSSLAIEMGSRVPNVTAGGSLVLDEARNPVFLRHVLDQPSASLEAALVQVVPLSLEMDEEHRVIVITGPNAGGKSVALKTVGVLTMLAAYGLPIPAGEATRIPLPDALMVDIGDQQSIENDLSTFSSHVQNLAHMAEKATAESLVLIDEMGTGTDPLEGAALAQAVLELLRERGTRTLITTHLGALKAFAHESEGVVNASMAFDEAQLAPTYAFQWGIPGSSYAFEIGRRMALPPSVIARAKALVGDRAVALEDLIRTLQLERDKLAEARASADAERSAWLTNHEQARHRAEALARERNQIRAEAHAQAQQILKAANREVERTIREIKESQAAKAVTQAARASLTAARGKAEADAQRAQKRAQQRTQERAHPNENDGSTEKATKPRDMARKDAGAEGTPAQSPDGKRASQRSRTTSKRRSTTVQSGPLAPGDRVRIDGGEAVAEVVEVTTKEVVVAFNAIQMRVKPSRLSRVGRREQKVLVKTSETSTLRKATVKTRIDLRGERVEDALMAVERFIDEAGSAGANRLEILHGTGTGALRVAIHDYVRTRADVVGSEAAPWDEGGPGVTIIRLG